MLQARPTVREFREFLVADLGGDALLRERVVKQLASDASSEQLATAMRAVIVAHPKVAKDSRTHRGCERIGSGTRQSSVFSANSEVWRLPLRKSSQPHRAEGERVGAFWETKLSIGDPHEVSARERTKAAIQRLQPGKPGI